MSDERMVDVGLWLEILLRQEVEKRRMAHSEVITVLAITLGTFIADIPQGGRRAEVLERLRRAMAGDVEDEALERRQI